MPSIIGLDISTKTGYSVINIYTGSCLDTGIIKCNKATDYARWDMISRAVVDLINEYDTVLAIIEGFAYGSVHRHTAKTLIEVATVIKFKLYSMGVPWLELPPSRLKKYTTGNGRATKQDMIKAVKDNWGVITRYHDIADAVGLAYFGLGILGREYHNTDYLKTAGVELPLPVLKYLK